MADRSPGGEYKPEPKPQQVAELETQDRNMLDTVGLKVLDSFIELLIRLRDYWRKKRPPAL